MADEMRILREDLTFARRLAVHRDNLIAELKAKCVVLQREVAHLKELAARLATHAVNVSGEAQLQKRTHFLKLRLRRTDRSSKYTLHYGFLGRVTP